MAARSPQTLNTRISDAARVRLTGAGDTGPQRSRRQGLSLGSGFDTPAFGR